MPFRPAVLSYDDLRRRAEAFLDEFHAERTLPVPIEEIVEFDFELEVVPIDGILDDLEVDAFLTSDLKRVYVDAFVLQHRRGRYRFSLAHELAHYRVPLADPDDVVLWQPSDYPRPRVRQVGLAELAAGAAVARPGPPAWAVAATQAAPRRLGVRARRQGLCLALGWRWSGRTRVAALTSRQAKRTFRT